MTSIRSARAGSLHNGWRDGQADPTAQMLDWFNRAGRLQVRGVGATPSVARLRSPEALSRADIARTARVLEAADRLREEMVGQPQHDIRQKNAGGDRPKEHDIDRQ